MEKKEERRGERNGREGVSKLFKRSVVLLGDNYSKECSRRV